jgi:hypothetical protein
MFSPCLSILPPAQLRLWPELKDTPDMFTLYGGTAIALRLGHRYSVDFDFFSTMPFQPRELLQQVPYLRGATLQQSSANTLTCLVDRDGPVQLSFFGGLSVGQVEKTETVEGALFEVASLTDLAGMKAAVVTQRAEIKDYLDIHALMTQAGITLPFMLAAAAVIYGDEFNPLIALKAIGYHDDPALVDLPASIRSDLVSAVRRVDLKKLPYLSGIREKGSKQ